MDAKELGLFIAQVRREQGMTQAELADKLHVTDKAVSRWERGQGLPDINTIEPLAEALGVSVAEVMGARRIVSEQMTQESASELLTDAFDIVRWQRKEEHTKILLILSAILAVLVVLLMGPMMTIGVFLPCLGIVASVVLLFDGIWRKRNQLPCARTFALAGIMALIPILMVAALFAVGILGLGPVPS